MYFLPVFGLFFKILLVSFEMLRFLILLMSNFNNFFPFMDCAFDVLSNLPNLRSKRSMFTSRSFYCVRFYIKVDDTCWVCFCVWCEVRSKLLILHMITQLFQQHLLKKLFFIELSRHLYWNVLNHKCVGLFLDFFCSID